MSAPIKVVGRYALFQPFASGGMGVIHIGRLEGPMGFGRTVAIKRLHPSCADNGELAIMLGDEARLASRIDHPNVVRTLDVVAAEGELLVVMELVQGVSLSSLMKSAVAAGERIPVRVAVGVVVGLLYGLHAAHEATSESGRPLDLVHRDVSPQNVLVGSDGVPRVVDFGVAKAMGRLHTTRDGSIRGKMAYMPVEQLAGEAIDRRADVYATAVVLWELLTGKRLFARDSDAATVTAVLHAPVPKPSEACADIPAALDAIVTKGLARDRDERFPSALEMAAALEDTHLAASPREIAAFVKRLASEPLALLSAAVRSVEAASSSPDVEVATDDLVAASASETTSSQHAMWTPRPGDAAAAVRRSADETVSEVATTRPARRRPLVLLAGAFVAVLGASVGGYAVRSRVASGGASAGEAQPAASSEIAIPTIVRPQASAVAVTATVAAPPTYTGASPAAPSATPAATPRHTAAAPVGALASARPRASGPETTEPPAPKCDPPWVLDESGVRRIKLECMK